MMMRIDPAAWAAFCAGPTEGNFGPFYEQSKGLVWTLCWRILRDEDEAQDAFQGVYARLLLHARQTGNAAVRDSSATISRLIYQTAIREANRLRLRRHRRGQREVVMDALTPQPAGDPSARDTAAQAQARARIEALVAALPEKYRLPLELHYFHGMTQDEIATLIGRTQGTVSQRIARGLRLLEPIAERAGLGRAAAVLSAIAAGASFCQPPAAQAASVVFANAQALIAAGGLAAGGPGGLATLKLLAGTGLTQVKAAILATLALSALVTATLFGPGLYARLGSPKAPAIALQVSDQSKSALPSAQVSAPWNAPTGTTSTQAITGAAGLGAPQKSRPITGAVITGWTLSQATNRPVAGVRIQAVVADRYQVGTTKAERDLKIETVSDARGQYRLEGLPLGKRMTVIAQPSAYAWQARLVQPASPANEARCDLALEPAGEVAVTVTDPAGQPIEKVSIGVDDQTSAFLGLHVETDAQGHAIVRNLSPTRATLIYLNKTGYVSDRSQTLQFPAGRLKAEMKFVMPRRDADQQLVTGKVTDPKGAPLPGITIQWGITGDNDMARTQADPEGRYRLSIRNLDSNQALTASGKGWATQSKYNLKDGGPASQAAIDFVMQPGHWLAGIVVDDRGRPLKDIEMDLTSPWPGTHFTNAQRDQKTDAQGRFRIEDLPANGLGLNFWGGGFPQEHLGNLAPDRELRIVLKPAGQIRGRVIDKTTRRPITSFSISIAGISAAGDRSHSGQTFSSPEGCFELGGLKQGEPCEFTVEALGYPPHVEKNIPVAAPDSTREWTIELSTGRQLRGLLMDRDSGTPLAGAEVIYALVDERFPLSWGNLREMNSSARILQRQTTDAQGSFTLSIGEEPGTILILPQKHQRLMIKPLDRGKYLIGDTLVVKLGPAATVTGKALIDGVPKAGAFVQLINTAARFTFGASESDSQRTDNDGSFSFEGFKAGNYEMIVQRGLDSPLYHTYHRALKLAEGEQKILNIGDGLGACSLAGAVLDHGRPVPNIIVELTPQFTWEYTLVAGHSNDKGVYVIQGLRPGAYKAKLSQEIGAGKPGEKPLTLEETIQVTAQDRHDFEFKRGHAVTARLIFPAGAPAEACGALSNAVLRLKNRPLPFTKDAAKDGIDDQVQGRIEGQRLTFEGRFKGEYVIELAYGVSPHSHVLSLPRSFTVDNTSADPDLGEIPVPATGLVRFRVRYSTPAPELPPQIIAFTTPSGHPAEAGATLYLDPQKEEQSAGPVPVGMTELRLFAPGYKIDPTSVTVTIKAGGEAGPRIFTLSPEGILMGAITEKGHEQEKPVRADHITLTGPACYRTLAPAEMKDLAALSAKSAKSGIDFAAGPIFRFGGLAAGVYTLTAEAAGYKPASLIVEVTPGKEKQVPIVMTPAR